MTRDQERVLSCLDAVEPVTPDEISAELNITDDRVRVALSALETARLVRRVAHTIPTGWVLE